MADRAITLKIVVDSKDGQLRVEQFGKALGTLKTDAESGGQGLTKTIAIGTMLGNVMANVAMKGIAAVKNELQAVIREGMEFDRTGRTMANMLGLTADQTERMKLSTRALALEMGDTAQEIQQVQLQLARLGFAYDSITKSTETINELTENFGGSIAGNAELIRKATDMMGGDFSKVTEYADKLAKTMQSGQFGGAERFGMGFQTMARAAEAFDYQLNEVLLDMKMFADAHVEGTRAGMAYQLALSTLSSLTDGLGEKLRNLGLTYEQVNPEQNKFSEIMVNMAKSTMTAKDAIDLFGSRTGVTIYNIVEGIRAGKIDIEKFNETLTTASGTLDGMHKKTLAEMPGQLKQLGAAFKEVRLQLWDTIKDLEAVGAALGVVGKLIQAIVKDARGVKDMADYFESAGRSADYQNKQLLVLADTTQDKVLTSFIKVSDQLKELGVDTDSWIDAIHRVGDVPIDTLMEGINKQIADSGFKLQFGVTANEVELVSTKQKIEKAVAEAVKEGGEAGTKQWEPAVLAATATMAGMVAQGFFAATETPTYESFKQNIRSGVYGMVREGVLKALQEAIVDAQIIQPLVAAINSLQIDITTGAVSGLERVREAADSASERMEILWPIVQEVTAQFSDLFPALETTNAVIEEVAAIEDEQAAALAGLTSASVETAAGIGMLGQGAIDAAAAMQTITPTNVSGGTTGTTSIGGDYEMMARVMGTEWANQTRTLLDYLTGGQSGFAGGTSHVPRTGIALVHEGERIIRREEVRRERHNSYTFNITALDPIGMREVIRTQIAPELRLAESRNW